MNEEIDAFMEQVHAAVQNLLTLGGKLKTVEDYRAHFDRNLIGVWSTDKARPSPMDKSLVFYADGTGTIASEFFYDYSGEFQWREADAGAIEVHIPEESPEWFRLTWSFSASEDPETGKPAMRLYRFIAPDCCEFITEITFGAYHFGGLPRRQHSESLPNL